MGNRNMDAADLALSGLTFRDLRLRRNEALWNRARRTQGIPSLNHSAASHPTTMDSGSAAGPGFSTGS